MDAFEEKLNILLTETFDNILKIEETNLKRSKIDATISEIHLIDTIGRKDAMTVSDIAGARNISPASVTVAVNKLVRKGYLVKEKNPHDGRSVFISLTKSGRRAYRLHRFFHQKMVDRITLGMSEEEKASLYHGLTKMNNFFEKNAVKLEK